MSSLGVMHDDDWKPKGIEITSQGRYPANVIHDGPQEEWAGDTFIAPRHQQKSVTLD